MTNKNKAAATDGTLGTDTLKELIKYVIKCIQKATTIDDDQNKKISIMEVLNVMASLGFKFPAIYNSLPAVKAEWKDLTQAELDDLVIWFAAEFDLPRVEHGKLKLLIKKTVAIIVDNYNHVQDIKTILG